MNRLSETVTVLAIAAGGVVLAAAVSDIRPSPAPRASFASDARSIVVAMGDRWQRGQSDDWPDRHSFADEGVCEPADALRQGRRAGLKDAGVKNVSPDYIIVGGQRHGGYDEVVLVNRRGCPFA